MNFELLVRQYLYQNKSISLPGIGRLYFDPSTQLPSATSDKNEAIELQNLHFDFDLQQQAEPEFVKFVSTHTGKIAPLASSDVDSHFMLCKQFINIGKAYIIEGVGVIEKKDDGSYGFTPGTYIPVSDAATVTHKPLKVREPKPVIPKDSTPPRGKQVNYKNIMIIAALVLLIGLAAWAAYYFFVQNRPTDVPPPQTDTIPSSFNPANGSSANIQTANLTTPAPLSNDPNAYKAVFEVTNNRDRALTRLNKLRTYGVDVQIESPDSSTFRLWVPITAAPADTMRKKDSLSLFFARKVILERR